LTKALALALHDTSEFHLKEPFHSGLIESCTSAMVKVVHPGIQYESLHIIDNGK
jgi:hypothetical protein